MFLQSAPWLRGADFLHIYKNFGEILKLSAENKLFFIKIRDYFYGKMLDFSFRLVYNTIMYHHGYVFFFGGFPHPEKVPQTPAGAHSMRNYVKE